MLQQHPQQLPDSCYQVWPMYVFTGLSISVWPFLRCGNEHPVKMLSYDSVGEEGTTGQHSSKQCSRGAPMPAFLTCCGTGLWSAGVRFFSSGTTLLSCLTLTFTHSHLCLLQACTGIVTCSQGKPASGTFGCLSEMAFPVHHPAYWRSVQCALLHGQRHRVTLGGTGAASHSHCANLVVETSRKPDKRLIFGGIKI